MPITTRINGSSEDNFLVQVINIKTNEVVTSVTIKKGQQADLQITAPGCYLKKVNGWESKHME